MSECNKITYSSSSQINKEENEKVAYTADTFCCGLCRLEMLSIDDYVNHMTLVEHCVLMLCPSSTLSDVLLPRFVKKSKDVKYIEEIHKDQTEPGKQFLLDENEPDYTKVSQIYTGEKPRWKCKICLLTFSRYAAFINHYKLQHSPSSEISIVEEQITLDNEESKNEMKNEIAPVKHIIAIESKPLIDDSKIKISKEFNEWQDTSCHQCGQVFKTGRNLKTHLSVVHSDAYPFVCEYSNCGQEFKTKGSYKRHLRRHTGERPYICKDCGRCFRESGSLARHRKSQGYCKNKLDNQLPLYGLTKPISKTNHEQKPSLSDIEEDYEDHLFNGKEDLDLNSNDLNDNNSPPEESKAAVKAQILRNKLQDTGSKSEPSITLKKSRKPLKIKSSPQKGLWLKSEPGGGQNKEKEANLNPSTSTTYSKPNIKCKMEPGASHSINKDTEFYSNRKIKFEHIDKEDEDIKPNNFLTTFRKSFLCPICPKTFHKKIFLDQHLKKHLDEYNMKCNQCNKEFTTEQALIRHLISHSNIRQYECSLCNKIFKLPSHAKIHLNSHSSERPYACQECGSLFKSISARNVHQKIHTGNKAFSCIQCDKSFLTKASLDRHYRTHTGETPFHCPYCEQGFKEHGTLKRHLNNKMPCSQQAKLGSKQVGIQLVNEKLNENWIKDLKPLLIDDITFDEADSDILNGTLSPTLTSMSDDVGSLFSSSVSVCSRPPIQECENETIMEEDDFVSNIPSSDISNYSDNSLQNITYSSFKIPSEEERFQEDHVNTANGTPIYIDDLKQYEELYGSNLL